MATRRTATWVSGFADGWPDGLRWLVEVTVQWGVGKLAFAVMGFLAVPLTLFAGAPFYVLITRSLEKRLAPPGPPPHSDWLRASGFVMSQTVLLTLVVMFGGLVVTPVLLVPGVNLLAASVIAIVLNGFAIGLIALGLPLHHRGISGRREHLRYAWRNRWAVVGFGGMSVLILSIPFSPLRWFSVPAVFVGAVLLQRSFPLVPVTALAAPFGAAPAFGTNPYATPPLAAPPSGPYGMPYAPHTAPHAAPPAGPFGVPPNPPPMGR